MKAKNVGILSAILGSICCVGPLLLIALGLGTFAAVIGRYHWFFIGAATAVLTYAWGKHFREQARCACEHRSLNGLGITLVTLLLASTIVGAFAVLNFGGYVFASSAPPVASVSSANVQRVVIPVEGMSCVTCEIAVRHALKRIDGVKSAHVSAAKKTATVDYESAKTNPEQLAAAINATGYRASSPNKMNDSPSMAKNRNTNGTRTDSALTTSGENAAVVTADRISVYKVPLVCPAAPQIGCGSASKPILLDLEKQPGVLEAWLNRAGTRIAVVWKPDSDAEKRRKVAADLQEDSATELDGKLRDETVADFLSGKGWYRGADVDRLSEEEAGVIAARWVRRVQAKAILPKDKAAGLEAALTNSLRKELTSEHGGPNEKELSVEQVAGSYIGPAQIKILKEAIDEGMRQLPKDER